MFGMNNMISGLMSNKLEETLAVIQEMKEQFENAVCSSSQMSVEMIFFYF